MATIAIIERMEVARSDLESLRCDAASISLPIEVLRLRSICGEVWSTLSLVSEQDLVAYYLPTLMAVYHAITGYLLQRRFLDDAAPDVTSPHDNEDACMLGVRSWTCKEFELQRKRIIQLQGISCVGNNTALQRVDRDMRQQRRERARHWHNMLRNTLVFCERICQTAAEKKRVERKRKRDRAERKAKKRAARVAERKAEKRAARVAE
jgi:hypothetical protein